MAGPQRHSLFDPDGMVARGRAGVREWTADLWEHLRETLPSRYPVVRRPDWLTPARAVALLAAIFVAGFGLGIFNSVRVLWLGVPAEYGVVLPTFWNIELAANWVAIGVLVVVAALLVPKALGLTLAEVGMARPRGRREWANHSIAFLLAVGLGTAANVAWAVVHLGGVYGYPLPAEENRGAWWRLLVGGLLAGPTEELVLILLVCVLLRAIGWRWLWVIAVATLLRCSFHLYYGWGTAVAVLLWVPGTVLLYRRVGAIWAIAAAHSFGDVSTIAVAYWLGRGLLMWVFLTHVLMGLVGLLWAGRREPEWPRRSGPRSGTGAARVDSVK